MNIWSLKLCTIAPPARHLVLSLPDVFRRASRRLLHALLPLPLRRRRSTDEPVVVIQHTPSAVRVLHTPTVWPRQSAEVLLAAFLLCSMLMTMNYCLIEVILIVIMNYQWLLIVIATFDCRRGDFFPFFLYSYLATSVLNLLRNNFFFFLNRARKMSHDSVLCGDESMPVCWSFDEPMCFLDYSCLY